MIIDTLQNMTLYYNTPGWTAAIHYLAGLSEDSPDGEYDISDRTVFARVMSYETKPETQAVPEAHRKYADIQVVLSGQELVLWDSLADLAIKTPYDDTTDVAFYYPKPIVPVKLLLRPGMFAAFFPEDAHRPSIATENAPGWVKKVVVKIDVNDFIR